MNYLIDEDNGTDSRSPFFNGKECTECNGCGVDFTSCCGATLDEDVLICPICKEHCDVIDCEECNGKGYKN